MPDDYFLSPAGPLIRRVEAIDASADPEMICVDQLTVIMDEYIAGTLRKTRTGEGETLRERGFTATADELGNWTPIGRKALRPGH